MFSDNALKVLEKRYFLRDERGAIKENAEQICKRVADAVATAETRWDKDGSQFQHYAAKFFELMFERKFFPNSPTLMNAGKPNGQLSACFVLPVPDSLEGIFETCKNAALIHKTGGGTGFSFSRLRPANDRVANSVGVASGPISFMTVYDAATEAIRQGGARRGANMGILRVDHPDIEEFISCKSDTSKLNNFNISVAATDAFMQAVETNSEYELLHPATGKPVRKVRARQIFDRLVANAHSTGEPGLVFIDRINNDDPVLEAWDENGVPIPGTETIEATNPCGEQPLGPGDACNLGSINLAEFVDTAGGDFNWADLADAVASSVRFLDDVVNVNHYPLPFINSATLGNRRIGLGVMGWAEALILLNLAYDSDEAIEKAEQVMSFINKEAHRASSALAEERGVFPNWEFSSWKEKGVRLRNATVTTIAPTGTISIIAGTSSGIEPLFAVSFVRRVLSGMELIDVNPLFEKVAKERGFYSVQLMARIAHQGTLANIEEIPEDVRRVWVCSHDIHYSWHVKMQVAFQKHTDNAVSKTINFPHTATIEDVGSAYLAAWTQGLKGITVYRDGSRQSQVLNIAATDPLRKTAPVEEPVLAQLASAPHDYYFSQNGSISQSSSKPAKLSAPDSAALAEKIYGFTCPECSTSSESMMKYDACRMCVSCGYTKC